MFAQNKIPIFLPASTFRHIANFEGLAAAINAVPVFAGEAWLGKYNVLGKGDECSVKEIKRTSRRFVARMPDLEFCYKYASLDGRNRGACFESAVIAYGTTKRKALKELFEGILDPWKLLKYVEKPDSRLRCGSFLITNPSVSIARGERPIIFTPQPPKAVQRFRQDRGHILHWA